MNSPCRFTIGPGPALSEGAESVAVCLLHSFENGAHERRCADVLRERGGFEWVSLSHEVVPVIGEYERGSTTVVNAYIGPKVVRYLQALDERLRALGLGPDLLVLQSNGRGISIRQVAHCPVNLVLSGPAGGVAALTARGGSGHNGRCGGGPRSLGGDMREARFPGGDGARHNLTRLDTRGEPRIEQHNPELGIRRGTGWGGRGRHGNRR